MFVKCFENFGNDKHIVKNVAGGGVEMFLGDFPEAFFPRLLPALSLSSWCTDGRLVSAPLRRRKMNVFHSDGDFVSSFIQSELRASSQVKGPRLKP